jgi:hypothetical protein
MKVSHSPVKQDSNPRPITFPNITAQGFDPGRPNQYANAIKTNASPPLPFPALAGLRSDGECPVFLASFSCRFSALGRA